MGVWRIENAPIWNQYASYTSHLSAVLQGKAPGLGVPTKTSTLLPKEMRDTLRSTLNEEYLFHGTSPKGALGITRFGFDLGRAGRSLYGPGLYFAESSSKSDEYAEADEDGLYQGLCPMLLCRVALGRILTWEEESGPELFDAWENSRYDSILGDREQLRGTYKEYVLPPESGKAVYPEYLIFYRRIYADSWLHGKYRF